MKYVDAIITAKPGREDKIRQVLKKLLEFIKTEKGIESFSIYECTEPLRTFVAHEVFQSQEAFDKHMESDFIKTLLLAENSDFNVAVYYLTEMK